MGYSVTWKTEVGDLMYLSPDVLPLTPVGEEECRIIAGRLVEVIKIGPDGEYTIFCGGREYEICEEHLLVPGFESQKVLTVRYEKSNLRVAKHLAQLAEEIK